MVAGKGFVPLGVDPATVPKVPVRAGPSIVAGADDSASLTMYVRSAAQNTSWFVIAPRGAVGAQGFNAGVGVGCLDVPVGGQLVMVDRPAPRAKGEGDSGPLPTSQGNRPARDLDQRRSRRDRYTGRGRPRMVDERSPELLSVRTRAAFT